MPNSNDKIGIINSQLFNKKETIVIADNYADSIFSNRVSKETLAGMLANFESLGYQFNVEDIKKMAEMSENTLIEQVYQPVLAAAKEAKGANVEHHILFPDFPDSVRNIDIDTLSNMRFMSYFTIAFDEYLLDNDPFGKDSLTESVRSFISEKNAEIEASQKTDSSRNERSETQENTKDTIRTIHLGTIQDYYSLVNNLLSGKTSLSEYDKDIVTFALKNISADKYMPETIPFKENWALVAVENFKNEKYDAIDIKSYKDFERLLAALTKEKVAEENMPTYQQMKKRYFGDISLSKKQHYWNFSNKERKILKNIFDNALEHNYPIMLESSLNSRAERFTQRVLNQRLHFNEIGNPDKYLEFIEKSANTRQTMSFYEEALQKKSYFEAAQILCKTSPSLFARNAKMLITKAAAAHDDEETENIIGLLEQECQNVPLDILLTLSKQIQSNISAEDKELKFRFAKSTEVKAVPYMNTAEKMPRKARFETLTILNRFIKSQLSTLPDLGKVYVDPALKDCPIPLVGRNDSGKNRTVAMGTKLPLEKESDVVRFALYKKGPRDGYLDFSCAILDENCNFLGQVSWNNLKEGQTAFHSGDCSATSRGVTELIDIDMNKIKEEFPAAKSVAFKALAWGNFTTIDDLSECFVTVSNIDKVQDGLETYSHDGYNNAYEGVPSSMFNPADVQMRIDLTGNAYANMPLIFDIDSHSIVVLNMPCIANNLSMGQTIDKKESPAENKRHFNLPEDCMAIENFSNEISMTVSYILNDLMDYKVSIYDLALKNIFARHGSLVDTPEEADVIFSTDRIKGNESQKVVSPFDKDIIATEFMVADFSADKLANKSVEDKLATRLEEINKELRTLTLDDIMNDKATDLLNERKKIEKSLKSKETETEKEER